MHKEYNIKINIIDLYRFLVSECRYAYTRNNHLMPVCAFEEAKEYLNLMFDVDEHTAIHTAKQLCEECISLQLVDNFSDREDDEFYNKKKSLEFVEYLLEWISEKYADYTPYNYDMYCEIKKEMQ